VVNGGRGEKKASHTKQLIKTSNPMARKITIFFIILIKQAI
jgi:hypothetical protein